MSQKYDVTVTNPPYMGNAGMTEHLKKYLKKNYPNSEKDMMTAFMDLAFNITKVSGIISMINLPSWMFLSSCVLQTGLISSQTRPVFITTKQ